MKQEGYLKSSYIVSIEEEKEFEEFIDNQISDFEHFVKDIDKQITEISYTKKIDQKILLYELETNKNIEGNSVKIPFSKESSGTKIYIEYYNIFKHIEKSRDMLYLWDEFDLHMHEMLSTKLAEYLKKLIAKNNVQILITTHNLNLLSNKNFENKEKYIMKVNPLTGNRSVRNLLGEDVKGNNKRKYELGLYGGIPSKSDIYWTPNE